MTALMGNEIQIALAGLATVLPHARGGRLKALAVTGNKRAQIAPEVPTVAESGVPGYQFDVWTNTPEAFGALIAREASTWAKS
ncbi:MAG: Uncharacterized protein K0R53_287 [Burkholderiales bacterium]|jgi:tripartite-type tricarboxylate transporter receptor subunit TctC|nr:Uncharacterized protein [Burkholderiales bacterium]